MSMVILADLDDTLFTTKVEDPHQPGYEAVTESPTGRVSYINAQGRMLLNWIQQGNTLIPVTARCRDAFGRVRLPFTDGAIIANGAVILRPDGQEDQAWSAYTRHLAVEAMPAMDAALSVLSTIPGGKVTRHVHHGALYGITAKSDDRSRDAVHDYVEHAKTLLASYGLGDVVWTHTNSNFIALVPDGISKQAAVQRLLDARSDLRNRPLVGAGDSISDLEFMQMCDFLMIPRRSQNATALLSRSTTIAL